MKTRKKWLILLLTILAMMSLATYTGVTTSNFLDNEQSTDDALGIRWGLFILNDGFEATGAAWDDYWDENGTTTWIQNSAKPHSGTYYAYSDSTNNGYLTSDEIEASTTDNITVSFWFYPKGVSAGDFLVQTYNGTAYNTWYDLLDYPTYNDKTWCEFNEVITDSQYLIAGFRLRFYSSGLGDEANIDDVVITTDSIPPVAPTGLFATGGNEEISLDWNDNSDSDLWGYNVYRSLTSGDNYTQVNGDPVLTSGYTDTGLYGGGTYYYVVTAVDLGNNESGNSNQASATANNIAPAAPTGLVATAGDEEISLDWNDNTETDLDGYNVYRGPSSGNITELISSNVSVSNYIDTGLYGGGLYYYEVTAVDLGANASGRSNTANATATDAAPAAPTGLVATPGNEEISLSWNSSNETDFDGFNVYRGLSSGNITDLVISSISTSNHTDIGLFGGGLYYYEVTAVDLGANESDRSNTANATAVDIAPAEPTGLAAIPDNEEISLNWDDNTETDIDGYDVYRGPSSGNITELIGNNVSVSNFTDTPLYGGGLYYYEVTAVDLGANESGRSNTASATAVDVAPATPTNLVATPGNEEISLNWDDNAETDIDGYDVYRGPSSGNITELISSNVVVSNYTDTGLYGGGLYYYEVTAVDLGANESGRSNTANATAVDVAPTAPNGLAATPGNEEISLNWDDNTETDLDGYNVYRGPSSGNITDLVISGISTSNYTDTGLYGGGLYYYEVTAVDLGTNESGRSNTANATAIDIAPSEPTDLVATPGDGLVSLVWTGNTETDLDGYNVYRGPNSGNTTELIASLVATSNYTDIGLTGGVTYYYVVTAVDLGSNESGSSNEDSATPIDNPPSAPTGLVATPGDIQISLDWDDNSEGDLDGYNVYRGTSSGNITDLVVSSISTSNYTDTGLYGGGLYYYEVTAVDLGTNESDRSNTANATATDSTPAAPTGLVATKGIGQVSLDWDDNSEGDLDGYNIYRGTSSGNYTQIDTLVSLSSYTDNNSITNGVRYYYVVTAVDFGSNESSNSNEDNARPVGPPQTLLTDDFEGTPWDDYWDENGTTDWAQSTVRVYSGTYSAGHIDGNTYLTSDNLDTFAAENITISFWFQVKDTAKGPLYLQAYNGSAYNNLYNLTTDPGWQKDTFIYFSMVITDTQYFIADFKIRFDGSTQTTNSYIEDVLIEMNQ